MSKRILAIAVLLIVPALMHAQPRSIEWQKDYGAAVKMARQAGKPLLIDFWASWCKPCKAMDEQVWPRPEVQRLSARFVCVSLDFDRSGSEVRRFDVHFIPATIIVDPWNNVMYRHDGYVGAAELAAAMSAMPADFSEIAELQKTLDRDGKNAATLTAIGDFYNKRDILAVSNFYYGRALKTRAVESDPAARENLLVSIGVNSIRLKQYDAARISFETCLKSVPNGSQCARAMLGLLITQVELGKRQDAEKTLAQMREKYPNSPATQQAEQHLRRAAPR